MKIIASSKQGKFKTSHFMTMSILLCTIVFLAVSFPLSSNNLPYLDDFYLMKEQELLGFWGPTNIFQSLWGYYRIVYTSLMSAVFSASDHMWALRVVGMTLHACTAALLYIFIKNCLQSRHVALIAFAMFLFFPYAYEAIAWPSNVGQYPLAPFLALLGACIVVCYGTQKLAIAICGALIMAFSFWIHEQVGPIVLALTALICFQIERRSHRFLFAVSVVVPVFLNLLLIYLTREHNIRLSGVDAARVDYLFINVEYIKQLIRTTPLGDMFYASAGIGLSWVSVLITATAMVSSVAIFVSSTINRDTHEKPLSGRSITFITVVFILMVGTYLVSLVPILLSPIPWHTARVVYIPFLAFAFAFAAFLEFFHRLTPPVLMKTYSLALSLLAVGIILWQTHALSSEAVAYDYQIRLNDSRSREAVRLVDRAHDLTETSLLVIRGFPGSDNGRPQFGEHIIGMVPGQFRANLGFRVYNGTPLPRFSFASGWDGLCINESGHIAIQANVLKKIYEWEKIKSLTYLIYANGYFTRSYGHGPRFDPGIHPTFLSKCKSVN